MGTLTQTEMKTELAAALGNRDDITTGRQTVFLNLAQTRIARMEDWNELQAIDTGIIGDAGDVSIDKYEDIPSNIRKIYSFRIVDTASKEDSRRLRYVPTRLWDDNVPETQAWDTDTPVIYTIWRNKFEFFPIPEQSYNYEIRSCKWPTEFSSGTGGATSDLDHKDDMIISLAVSWAFLTLREMEEANRWWAIYREMMKNATGQDTEEHEIDIRPQLFGQGLSLPNIDPWTDPFNRSGRIR